MDLSVQWRVGSALRVAVLALSLAVPAMAPARDNVDRAATVAVTGLPVEARAMHAAILAGGPFDSAKDGAVFGNRERLLIVRPRGYYREYTVRTPRLHNRGARRIVCGGAQASRPDACFYTDDHYASFRRIVQ